ncbi:MAG: ribose-phosphate pyrophosphokinase [Bacillota bacterium]|jgi:ribose-phosphate pyrophosphokinase|nr:ribose-phosphate pyrophosphokinase [Bacillota bacterium]NLU54349.1 ribose-phosphate pyrophosphokinase [Bacillota bacterium]HOA91712.1 ribose-phosphate pyrophosphokinase [Bacillota bacterium]HOJ47094.1 ribose-phosphate pyrophosphokinase [Bacillota bacterium]HPQ10831.1 ribose-phosphate pyrophosphokinase [Bacillota bacterium]
MSLVHKKMKIFSGNANPALAREIASNLGMNLGDSSVTRFKDEEISVNINETVRGADVFIIQPTSKPVNENLMELLIMIDACRRASAKSITAVIPYYGYARQDRKTKPREPIAAKLVANLITAAGANRVLTVDLHAGQIQGFFDIPVDNLKALPILANYFIKKGLRGDDVVVVSPDVGGVTRARELAGILGTNLAIIDKRRPKANVAEVMNIIGDVKGKTAIMIDDMIDTAGTITQGAQAILDAGAVDVMACCSHAVFSKPAIERLRDSVLSEVVVTNSVPLSEEGAAVDKIKVLSIASLLAEAMRRIYEELSVSVLF